MFTACYTGVYTSVNGGSTWTAANTGITASQLNSLAIDGTTIYGAGQGTGVFVSTNNGLNWAAANTGLTSTQMSALGVNGGNVYCASGSGVAKTSNNGANWTNINTGLTTNNATALAFNGNTDIFAGTPAGVYLTTNTGGSWTNVSTGLGTAAVVSFTQDGTYIYAGALFGSVGVWRRPLSEMVTVGIKENANQIKMEVYPNPSNGNFVIETNSTEKQNVQVMDVNGKIVLSQIVNGTTSIDAANLNEGVYSVSITGNNQKATKKLVIVK